MKHANFRPFAGPSDFAAMAQCANASFAADQLEFFRTADDLTRDYASFTDCIPARDVWIAEIGNEIAGYVRSRHWAQADGLHLYGQIGFVAPKWRRQGIGIALQAWIEAHQRKLATTYMNANAHAHHAFVMQGETARTAMLAKAGYHAERYFFEMVRPTLDAIADFPMPSGIEIRPVHPEHLRKIWDAHQLAFTTHWGYAPNDEAVYQQWLKTKAQQPELWQVAWDSFTDEVAGQVKAFVDESYNMLHKRKRGWTEFISVGKPWRKRGIARALIAKSLQAQAAVGMQDSGLGVDGENLDGATRVYEACGFVVIKRNCIYRKPMKLDTPA